MAHSINLEMPGPADVPTLARAGIYWSTGLVVGRYVISLASSAVLARFVSPSDFGVLAMVATFTVLIQVISDCGLSWATVQRHELTRNQVDALFWVNTGIGVALTILCLIAAPFVARFYGRVELKGILAGVSVALLFSSVAVQPNALMRRQMQLRAQSLCTLYSSLIGSAVAIAAAILGLGHGALVIQLVLGQAIATALAFWYTGYSPRIPRGALNVSGLLVFGVYSAAYGILIYFARNLDNVLIGKYWGATDLGYYSRAYFLMTLPGLFIGGMFAGIVIPSMASYKNDPAHMEFVYVRAVRMITMIGCPLAAGLLATAPEFVRLVYGPNWTAVVPILGWLSLACLLQPIHNTAQWIYVALERGWEMLMLGVIVAGSSVMAFVVGLPAGPVGVARAYAIANTLIALPILFLAHRSAQMDLRKTLSECAPPLCCAFLMGAVVWMVGVEASAAGFGVLPRFEIKIVSGIIVYFLALRQISRPAYSEILAELTRLRWSKAAA
jgi:O-antigen/teichoic acid export membrane protein